MTTHLAEAAKTDEGARDDEKGSDKVGGRDGSDGG